MGHSWDPAVYLAYADERARPFFDLTARIGAASPSRVVDLGCGAGSLTATLAQRWPTAHVHGVDSSPQMIETALPHSGERLTFEVGDLRDYRPSGPVDVLVANAVLQWLPDHLRLLERLVALLAPDGWLAVQVPANFDEPSHVLLDELAADRRFRAYTGDVVRPRAHEPEAYLSTLAGLGLRPDVWETTYLHVLRGPDPLLRWISGTRARPILQALPPALREEFEQEYAAALREAYPAREFGTVLPFRRIFAVGRRNVS